MQKRTVRWTKRALDDIVDCQSYYVENVSLYTANLILDRILNAAKLLSSFSTGRLNRKEGLLEKVVQKTAYIIVYRISKDSIEIVSIIHSSRNWTTDSLPS